MKNETTIEELPKTSETETGAEEIRAHIENLRPSARAAIEAPLDRRLELTYTDKFIYYSEAENSIARLEDAFYRPKTERPIGFSLIGDSNVGKTALVNELRRKLMGDSISTVGVNEKAPLVVVRLPGRATEPRVVLAVARALGLPFVNGAKPREVSEVVIRALAIRGVRMLVLVEFDNVKPIPRPEREVVYDFVKGVTNEGIVAVVVGTEDSLDLVCEEEELITRLRPLRLHGFGRNKGFQSFLRTLETYYPLPEPSFLWKTHARAIHVKTWGVLGEIVMLINDAAAWALRNEKRCIDTEALASCGYIPPAKPPRGSKE